MTLLPPVRSWVPLLARLARLIGPGPVAKLVEAEGGLGPVRIPHKPTKRHRWARALEPHAWQLVCSRLGGTRLELPSRLRVTDVRAEAARLRALGLTTLAIARRLDFTTRHVRRLLADRSAS